MRELVYSSCSVSTAGARLALLFAALAGLVPSANAGDLSEPDDDSLDRGRVLVGEKCVDCHSLRRVFNARGDSVYWQDAVGRMVEQGLDITADEKVDVVAFLAAQQESPSVSEAIGQFHFLMLHFPIVLIVVVGVAELWRLRHGAPLCRDTLHALVRLAVVTTVLTILFGLTLVSEWGTKPALLEWHRDAGLLTGACVIVAWLFRERAVRAQATFAAKGYRVALWAALLAVGLTGHLGGTLVHGDPLAGLLDHLR